MVGYNPGALADATREDHVVAGAVSGAISRAVSQPLDVIKIRFQIQIDPVGSSHESKYQSVLQAVRRISLEERTWALWKGHIPAQLLSVGYGVIQYTAFEYLTKAAWSHLPADYTWRLRPYTHAVCGGLSACAATLAVQPLDTIRTRFVAQGEPKQIRSLSGALMQEYASRPGARLATNAIIPISRVTATQIYTSIAHAARSIIAAEGLTGLFKGLVPSLTAVAPNMGIQFGLYSALQARWNKLMHYPADHHPGPVESFCCGMMAGTIAKSIVHPLDVIKKRLQVQGFEVATRRHGNVRVYHNLTHCVRCMATEEGLRGFYKGLAPSLLKAALVSAMIFCIYDQILIVLATGHSSS